MTEKTRPPPKAQQQFDLLEKWDQQLTPEVRQPYERLLAAIDELLIPQDED